MKSFKVDGFKFAILPVIIIAVIVLYAFLFFKGMPAYINLLNIGIDLFILLIYFRMFLYEIKIDSQGINVKGLLVRKRVLISDLKSLKQGGILTLIKTEKGRFFIVSSKKDRESIKNLFKDIQV